MIPWKPKIEVQYRSFPNLKNCIERLKPKLKKNHATRAVLIVFVVVEWAALLLLDDNNWFNKCEPKSADRAKVDRIILDLLTGVAKIPREEIVINEMNNFMLNYQFALLHPLIDKRYQKAFANREFLVNIFY